MIKNIYCDLYDTTIIVSYRSDKKLLEKERAKFRNDIDWKDYDNCKGYVVYKERALKDCLIVLNQKKATADVMAHECMHAVHHTMQAIGIVLSDDSEEAYAYFFGWLFNEIISFIKKVENK